MEARLEEAEQARHAARRDEDAQMEAEGNLFDDFDEGYVDSAEDSDSD